MNWLKKNLYKSLIIIILIIVGVFIYARSQQTLKLKVAQKSEIKSTTHVSSPQELLIESKGLAEFDPENDSSADNVSPQDKKVAEELMPILKSMGDAKNMQKNKDTITALGKIIEKYPDYSDAYFLRATISIVANVQDYQNIFADIDSAIKLHSSDKYKSSYDSTAPIYALRAKADVLSSDYQKALDDLEVAVKTNPDKVNDIFNTGGTKPSDTSNVTVLQKDDFDALVTKYPNDYRAYMFRGLFYNSFSFFDNKYYTNASNDLKQAAKLNPSSPLPPYFLGSVAQKASTFIYSFKLGTTSDYDKARDQINEKSLESFNQAIKLDPNFTQAYLQAAEALFSLKKYDEAIPYYDKVVEQDPNNAGALNDRGLAKTNTNNYYGAISDFSDAIRLKKSKSDSYLDMTYKNQADAYIKVADYDNAIADYSSAIGLEFGRGTISNTVPQIRAIYPEFKDISDQDLVEGLRQKYYPNLTSEDFAKTLKDNKDYVGGTSLAENYIARADALMKKSEFKKAVAEYARVSKANRFYKDTLVSDRWKIISKTTDTEYAIDVATLDFSKGNMASLWMKSTNLSSQNYTQQNFQIDCAERKIRSLSATDYDSMGTALGLGSQTEQAWQSIVPESIGEVLYNGMCK